MRARRWWLWIAALALACEAPPPDAAASPDTTPPPPARPAPPPQRPDPAYALRDTTPWENALYAGTRAVLVVDGTVIDTVEAGSLQRVPGGGFIYQPVRSTAIVSDECNGTCSDLHGWTMYIGYPVELSDMLPQLNAFFSSPAVIDSVLYYWGLDGPNAEGVYRISARLYDFRDRSLGFLHLYDEALATDNPGHFRAPYREDAAVVFETWDRRFNVTPDLSRRVE